MLYNKEKVKSNLLNGLIKLNLNNITGATFKQRNFENIFLFLILLISILTILSSVNPINAASQNINYTDPGGIKNAVSKANSGDTIFLDAGTYSGSNNYGITINKNITIVGKGNKNKIIINGEKNQIFKINNKIQLTLINVTLINGGQNDKGGAINNKGTLIIQNCDFKNNTGQAGGAIYNEATIFIYSSNFINNSASTSGSSNCYGGAIYNEGIAHIIGSNFVNNSVTSNNPVNTYGGAIYSKSDDLNVSYSIFLNNYAGNTINSIYSDGGLTTADYKWWGTNNFTNVQLQLSNVLIKNYYTISITTNSSNQNVNINEPFFYTFNMYLNGTSEKDLLDNFSYLNATITHPNGTTEYFDARRTLTWNYTPNSPGIYIVKAFLENQSINLTFIVNTKILMVEYIGDIDGIYNKNITLKVKVTDANNKSIQGIKVIFRINGKFVGESETDSNGIAILIYLCKVADSLQVDITTSTSSYYNNSTNAIIEVVKGETKVVILDFDGVFNEDVVLSAVLVDDEYISLEGFIVKFYVNGVYVGENTTNIDGVAYFTYTCKKIGNLTIEASFDGNENYIKSTNNSTLNVIQIPDPEPLPEPIPDPVIMPDPEPIHDPVIIPAPEIMPDPILIKDPVPIHRNINYKNAIAKSSIAMKSTGMPISAILLSLISIIGIFISKKKY